MKNGFSLDVLTPAQRSYCMSKIKSKHTKPEKTLRKIIKQLKFTYKLNSTLLGKPDIKIVGQKTVIFLDGCFWHGCPLHFNHPKYNSLFWLKKIISNKKRDKNQRRIL